MAKHLDVTFDTGIRVYFCDAASPWQRGTNENTNGPLRQYFPKSTGLSVHTPRDLARVEPELNQRPRMVLGDRSPHELFGALLASQKHPSLHRLLETKASLWPHFRTSSTDVNGRPIWLAEVFRWDKE